MQSLIREAARGAIDCSKDTSEDCSLMPRVVKEVEGKPLMIETSAGETGNRKMYCWGGRLHNCPQDFVLPDMTLSTLVSYWYCGSHDPHVPPLRYVMAYDLPHIRNASIRLSQMKRMMKEVVRGGTKVGYSMGMGVPTPAAAIRLYDCTKHLFRFPSLRVTQRRRYESLKWKTYHNAMAKNRWKFVGEN